MPRRTTSSGHSDNPATAMTSSGSNVWPATAAVVTALRASPDSRPHAAARRHGHCLESGHLRPSTSSRPDGPGTRRPLAARAEPSSRTKKGTPSVRSNTARRNEGATVPSVCSSRARWPRHRTARQRSAAAGKLGAARCAAVGPSVRAATRRCGTRQHQQWFGVQRPRQGAQQLRRSVVSPLEIVQEQHCWTPAAMPARACRIASKSVARSPTAAGGPSSGSSIGEVASQGTFDEWHIGRCSPIRPQSFHDWPERRRAALDGKAFQGLQA